MLYYGMLLLILLGSITMDYILLGDTMQHTTQYSEVGVGARNAHHDFCNIQKYRGAQTNFEGTPSTNTTTRSEKPIEHHHTTSFKPRNILREIIRGDVIKSYAVFSRAFP